jgi:hypothetical protein
MRFNQMSFSQFASQYSRLSIHTLLVSFIGLGSLILTILCSASASAASAANAQSPIAMNLLPVNYYTAEQPFLNIFKTTGVAKLTPTGWYTSAGGTFDTGEEAYLQLDANGYPTSLTASAADPHSPQLFNAVSVLVERSLPNANAGTGLPYRAGQYVVLYDGQGTLNYTSDAKLVSSSVGRDVINVATPTGGGIILQITATDPSHTGNYIRNIRVVKAEEESLLTAGNVFSPNFLSLMKNFRALRFMQWLAIDTNGGTLANWSSRPLITDAGWGGSNGVPIELAVQLCNALGSDCWLNVPHMATNDYITQMATVVHAALGSKQNAYIEYSNEVWNTAYAQHAYATAQGQAMWPSAGSGANYYLNWYGVRAAQTCDLWKAAWGADASRVICVMGAQAGNPITATTSLNCSLWAGVGNAPCSGHGIGTIAISPYLFVTPNSAWTSASDGGLTQLFAALDGSLSTVSAGEAAYKAALVSYNIPFIAYEGGQSLTGIPGYAAGSPMDNLFIAANRDPRMQAIYTSLFNDWKTNGGQLFAAFGSISGPNVYGEWGALESFLDTVNPLTSAPPKWQGIQNFISSTPCWWTGCVGTIGTASLAIPMPPTLTGVK